MPLNVSDKLVERYDLQELLGEGGSAQVFRALDQLLDRQVAIKVMHAHTPDIERQRFLQEVRVLARLNHSGVVPVLDIGKEPEGGRPFFSMPLLTGGPISVLGPLEDCKISFDRFLAAAIFVAQTLHYIHGQGFIHRDITPANVLLNQALMPQIMDFGLVSVSERTRDLTRSGVTLGTPSYMSPEQAKGEQLDARSDLYAMGAVLYRVACGSPPFVGNNDQSILYQHVYETPPDPRELNPAIPDALAHILLTLLAKRAERRPDSGQDLAHLWELARREIWHQHMRGQYRGGRTRSGEHPDGPAKVSNFQEIWSAPLPGEVTWPAAVVGHSDLVAVGTRGGQLVLTHMSGRPFATYAAKDEVTAPATFLGDHIFYGAWDGTLRRVDLQSGAQVWLHQARAEFTGAPTLWGQVVLAASRDGHLHALDARTGELTWAYKTEGPLAASPIIWGGAAFICDENGWLHAIDGKSGAPMWKVEIGTVHATPALYPVSRSQAVLIISTWNGEAHAISLKIINGRASLASDDPILWSYDFEEELWASPAITFSSSNTNNTHNNIANSSSTNKLSDGRHTDQTAEKSTVNNANTEQYRQQHSQAVVLLAGWGGSIRALSLLTGDDLWHQQLKGRITASPVISAGLVFVASEEGEMTAIEISSGKQRWAAKEKHGVQATPLLAAGTLYVAFMDGTLRAYRNLSKFSAAHALI